MSELYGIFPSKHAASPKSKVYQENKKMYKEMKDQGITEKNLKGFRSEAKAVEYIDKHLLEWKSMVEVNEYMYI